MTIRIMYKHSTIVVLVYLKLVWYTSGILPVFCLVSEAVQRLYIKHYQIKQN